MPLFPIDLPPIQRPQMNVVEIRDVEAPPASTRAMLKLSVPRAGTTGGRRLKIDEAVLRVPGTIVELFSMPSAGTVLRFEPEDSVAEPVALMSNRGAEMDWL